MDYRQLRNDHQSETLSAPVQTSHKYELMLISVLKAILDRYDKNQDYHFIDTKINLIDGQDYPDDDPIRGKGMIYSYIQGRGLEALAGHARWLEKCDRVDRCLRDSLLKRIHKLVSEVLSQMEMFRKRNKGRLFFMMTKDGAPVRLNANGQIESCSIPDGSNYSDLFYVKGMIAAADLLGLADIADQACNWFLKIYEDMKNGRFLSDQQPLDPKNIAAKSVPGRNSHGPRMIGIGAATVFLKRTKDTAFAKIGLDFLNYILNYHVNLGNANTVSKKYDMWEFTDLAGRPYVDEKQILLSDPGHACEFVGLALDLLETSKKLGCVNGSQSEAVSEYEQILPNVLRQNFQNGFSPMGFGICKGFDLISRKVLNSDMPWWSLPETMRSAISACLIVSADTCPDFEQIAIKCSNAFVSYYIKPSLNFMAIQTLNKEGRCADVIPATPDVDPGYHTGLSIIDCLEKLPKLKSNS
jgi:hypothetical protein